MFEATAITMAERRREQRADPALARQRRFARRDRWDAPPQVRPAVIARRAVPAGL